jgi:long-chain fatty acid transport protein
MKKIIILSAITSSMIIASGYKIPEQSVNSMALGAAYVAHTMGADTAYFNPAAMAFMSDEQAVEMGITLAHLDSQKYTLTPATSGETKTENILIPNIHYVAKAIGDFRWGASLTVPGGLTRRWETPYQKLTAEEFSLKIVEFNPAMSYRVNDNFSVGGGLRLIYSEGIVKSDGGNIFALKRDMKGDSVEFGYNLAMMYKATDDINFAMTYRSNVNLKEEGEANLYLGGIGRQYSTDVTIPLPAALNVSLSKTWQDKFTLEMNYERTFWSTFKKLDFNYKTPLANPILIAAFDKPKIRNWKDTNTFRVGATINMDNKLTAMLGFAIDETPVPTEYIGFELADSDAKIFSMGFKYQQTENFSWGASFLYDNKEARTLKPNGHHDKGALSLLNKGGEFSGGSAFLTTVGVAYEF